MHPVEAAFATNCHVGPDFVPCDPAELAPLLAHLSSGSGRQRGAFLPARHAAA
jgi:hypothetical protein